MHDNELFLLGLMAAGQTLVMNDLSALLPSLSSRGAKAYATEPGPAFRVPRFASHTRACQDPSVRSSIRS